MMYLYPSPLFYLIPPPSLSLSLSLSLSFFVSLYLPQLLSLSLSLFLCLLVSATTSLSLSLFLCLFVSATTSLSLSLSFFVSLYLPQLLSLSLSLSLSLCICHNFSLSLSLHLPQRLSFSLSVSHTKIQEGYSSRLLVPDRIVGDDTLSSGYVFWCKLPWHVCFILLLCGKFLSKRKNNINILAIKKAVHLNIKQKWQANNVREY